MSRLSEQRHVRQIQELQERAARAVPAAATEHRDGCWMRYDDGTTWWAGAALMHPRQQVPDLVPGIATAEGFYAAYGTPARFQVCPGCPPGLDDALSRRGYRRSGDVFLQVATSRTVARHLQAPPLRVDVAEYADAPWFDVLTATQRAEADPTAEWRLLQRVEKPSAYATAFLSGQPVAVGRAVADTGWVGVFGMATLPDGRHHGAARAVLAALTGWARAQGSRHLYLQVTLDSAAARRLYRGAGFEERCRYHYRTAVTC